MCAQKSRSAMPVHRGSTQGSQLGRVCVCVCVCSTVCVELGQFNSGSLGGHSSACHLWKCHGSTVVEFTRDYEGRFHSNWTVIYARDPPSLFCVLFFFAAFSPSFLSLHLCFSPRPLSSLSSLPPSVTITSFAHPTSPLTPIIFSSIPPSPVFWFLPPSGRYFSHPLLSSLSPLSLSVTWGRQFCQESALFTASLRPCLHYRSAGLL